MISVTLFPYNIFNLVNLKITYFEQAWICCIFLLVISLKIMEPLLIHAYKFCLLMCVEFSNLEVAYKNC